MVLDIDELRPEKGGNPDKVRENQRLRFCDESMVDKIMEHDEKWRKGPFVISDAIDSSRASNRLSKTFTCNAELLS